MSTDQAPDSAKKQETEHPITQSEMPDHGIAADVAGDNESQHASGENPVKNAGG
jgi:hypothetical protein